MARREIRVVVLFEDKAHRYFLKYLAKHLHLDPVRWENCQNNAGVLQRLGREVDVLRQQRHQKNLGLVVVIDADEKGLKGRVDELLGRIQADATTGARGDAERIALVVPAREIESWYVHLGVPAARPVDETRDYKPTPEWRALASDVGAAAKQAVAAWAPETSRVDPPSLSAAREELARVQ